MRILIPALAGFFGLLASVSAPATTLVHLSLEQLSQASSEVVRARVVGQESGWNSSRTQILTVTTVEIERTFKGMPRRTLVIEQPGGSAGNVRVRVPGTVIFKPGGSYYLFLEPAGEIPSVHRLVGMAQGAYRIYRHPQTGEERLVRPFGRFFYRSREKRPGATRRAQTISNREFRRELSAALAAPIAIPARTSIPMIVRSSEPQTAETLRLSARTAAAVYPSRTAIVPAGSLVQGTARLVSGTWKIRWSQVWIHGQRVDISAINEEPAGGPLQGRLLLVQVRGPS